MAADHGADSATEHAGDIFQPLSELTLQSAAIGSWLLLATETPRHWQYTYLWNGKQCDAKRFEVTLVSQESHAYCVAVFKRKGKDEQGFRDAMARFHKNTVWTAIKVALVKEKACYISSPLKIMIDLNSTTMTPVLQSMHVMPSEVTPLETLHDILKSPPQQRVDVTALIGSVSEIREHMTAKGNRYIADITIRDDSGPDKACQASFTVFLPKSDASKAALQKLGEHKTPMTFFALQCAKQEGKAVVKPDYDRFRWAPCSTGARAEKLMTNQQALLAAPTESITVISEIASFEPREPEEYLNVDATHTTCDLLAAVLRSGVQLMESKTGGATEHERALFQINHVRVIEPSGAKSLLTADGARLFPPIHLIDGTGAVEVRMREKTALELSDLNAKEDFMAEAADGALNFAVLCSVRILVKQNKVQDQSEETVSAVIVEAHSQQWDPKYAPNASMQELKNLFHTLPRNVERMMVAPLAAVMHSPHGGMVVNVAGKQQQCSCVLTLLVHTGKSHVAKLPHGHKIVSKNIWNIPYELLLERDDQAPEYADKKIVGEIASFCTMDNVQFYTLSPISSKEPVYALAIISSVILHAEKMTYMVDKIAKVNEQAKLPDIIRHLKKLSWVFRDSEDTSTSRLRTFAPSAASTPYTSKKARRLSEQPTDTSLPDPAFATP